MGNVIVFPKVRDPDSSRSETPPIDAGLTLPLSKRKSQATSKVQSGFPIPTTEHEAFLDLLREWPCFASLDWDATFQDVIELYYDDELGLSQDCVIEFMMHMREPDSFFDIGNALYTWEEADRQFFLLSLSMHAELIDTIKSEELDD